jgi:hypothetical protein
MTVRAVLDTSVLVPAWSRLVLQQLASADPPRFEPVWSEWIIAETWRTLAWRACGAGATWRQVSEGANRMLRYLLPVMHTVRLREIVGAVATPWPPAWAGLTDADDEPIWATAVLARAAYVVSENTRHFPPLVEASPSAPPGRADAAPGARHVYDGVEYLTAIEFVEDVLGEDAAAIFGAPLPPRLVRSRRADRPSP